MYPIYSMPIVDIRTRHLQTIIDNNKDKPTSCAIAKSVMNMVFKYAIMEDYVQTNYATYVLTPTIPHSTRHKPFTDEEINELWSYADDYIARIALILIYTGMRGGELCKLKHENIFLQDRYMIGGIKTKAGINRTIPIAEKIVPLLELNDKYPASIKELLGKWGRSTIPAIVNHLPHDGRHTCETKLNNAGVDIRTIQLIIGHSTRDVDGIYTHKTTDQLIEAINKI